MVGYYHSKGQSNADIAQLIGASQVEVSRSLSRLREADRLRAIIEFDRSDEEQRWLESQIRSTALEEEIRNRFWWPKSVDNDIIVVNRAGNEDTTASAIASFAAQRLLSFLEEKPDAKVGVSFGKMIWLLAQELAIEMDRRGRKVSFPEVTVFNLSGDMLFEREPAPEDPTSISLRQSYWSTALTESIAASLGCQRSICNIPSFMPVSKADLESDAIGSRRKQFDQVFNCYKSYQVNKSLLQHADMLITSVGNAQNLEKQLATTGRLSILPGGTIDALEAAGLVGDISGIPIWKNGPETDKSQISNTVLGFDLEALRAVSNNYINTPNTRGVMVLSAHQYKASAIRALLQHYKIVTQLILDSGTAGKVVR